MDEIRLRRLIGELADAFPRNGATDETGRVYVRELADLPLDALERAIRTLMRTSEFFPSIRSIRATVAEHTLSLPSDAEALAQIDARMAWGRNHDGAPPPLHPLVADASDLVGGWHAFRVTEQTVIRGQFLKLYRGMRAAAILNAQVGPELAPGHQRPELTP